MVPVVDPSSGRLSFLRVSRSEALERRRANEERWTRLLRAFATQGAPDGEAGSPLRFEATLAEGQKLSISVPGNLGEKSHVVDISRDAGKLVIGAPRHASTEVVVSGSVELLPVSVHSP